MDGIGVHQLIAGLYISSKDLNANYDLSVVRRPAQRLCYALGADVQCLALGRRIAI
jgi:hypothetical protein